MSELQKRLQMNKLPPMAPPSLGPGGKKGFGTNGRKRDYTPVMWNNYFESMQDIKVGDDTFRVYFHGHEGPVCFFLHGGGFSALSWACLTKFLGESVECRCVALDLRGHGDTHCSDEENISAEKLAHDVGAVCSALYADEPPPIILIGHSMGGALAAHVAEKDLLPSLLGLVVIDVVEGTALDALASMQTFLRNRPSKFNSLDHAIEWCVRSGHVRNLDSAKVSMLGQLKTLESNETATSELEQNPAPASSSNGTSNGIIEEDEEDSPKTDNGPAQNGGEMAPPAAPTTSLPAQKYTWRIDLANTEQYWRGWFEGLSSRFLSCSASKLLLLAGVDRLDRELTVGQMQGKFQMQVLPQCGHAVHEDVPDKVADVLATFMVRHKYAQPKLGFQRTFPAC